MPNPNGYDYFHRASAAYVGDSTGVDEITAASISDKPKKYPLAAKEAWLKKNAKALHLLREGLKYPALHPPIRSYFYMDFPQNAANRELARALAVESHARAARGDWNGAVKSVLDGYHFGNEIARGGNLITGLISVAIWAISLRELGNLIPHTNAATAKVAAASMEKIYLERYPYYETLQDEKWFNIGANLELMRKPSWRWNRVRDMDSLNFQDSPSPSWIKNAQMFLISKRSLLNNWTTTMDVLIQNAQQTYPAVQHVSDTGDPLIDTLLPVFKRARWNWARNDTFAVEIMTMYALHAYKLDHGRYPENLSALEPAYLPKIPSDPFDGMHSLHYQLQGENYLLWSIGPDGANNHGKPIINSNSGRRRYAFTSPDGKGDVVAGINMP